MNDCDPDCMERSDCERSGTAGHFSCGRCPVCGEPIHHACDHYPSGMDFGGLS